MVSIWLASDICHIKIEVTRNQLHALAGKKPGSAKAVVVKWVWKIQQVREDRWSNYQLFSRLQK